MGHQSSISEEHADALRSPYICIRCGEGTMIPDIKTNEPEYTDYFECPRCHFQDNIPAAGILVSQFCTSIFGALICLYLYANYIFDAQAASGVSEQVALGIVVSAFMAGFGFILYKATSGFLHRKLYTKHH